jgi:hypothetical protein
MARFLLWVRFDQPLCPWFRSLLFFINSSAHTFLAGDMAQGSLGRKMCTPKALPVSLPLRARRTMVLVSGLFKGPQVKWMEPSYCAARVGRHEDV